MKNLLQVQVIAEAGINHNGSYEAAKKLIELAKRAGANFVKFQTFEIDQLVRRGTEPAPYQVNNSNFVSDKSISQNDILRGLSLTSEMYRDLRTYSSTLGIDFFSTAFDLQSVESLYDLGQRIFKIPSGEITNVPLIKLISSFNTPIILSTGMSNLEEIHFAVDLIRKSGVSSDKITLLHCTSAYPTPFSDSNLLAIRTLQKEFGLKVGFSDHTLGVEAAIAAVALGACVIEKHITLDKKMPGPDHAASIEENELHQMISAIRNIEIALGNGKKTLMTSEVENIKLARKSIVAKKNIIKGEKFTEQNLTAKRPDYGISVSRWESIVGSIAKRDYVEDEYIADE